MNDNTIVLGKENAVNRLYSYIEGLGLDTSCVASNGDWVFIQFPTNFKCTPEHVVDIKNIFFWNLEVPFSAGLTHFSIATNCLHVYLKNYDVVTSVYKKLKEFDANVLKFDAGSGATDFIFSYTFTKRVALNYDELEEIRNIVNPARDRDHPVHQTTMHQLTDLIIHLDIM